MPGMIQTEPCIGTTNPPNYLAGQRLETEEVLADIFMAIGFSFRLDLV